MRFPRSPRAIVLTLGVVAVALAGCPDKKPKYPTCGGDDDCREGEHCVDKECRQCAEDAHCGEGETCEQGACVTRDGWCESDDDCPGGEICRDNQCEACQADRDCGPDGKCSQGACVSRGACQTDTDCADDEDCINGTCQRPGRGRTPDLGCELETVYFGLDRPDRLNAIDEAMPGELEATAACIRKGPEARTVLVVGHTDPRGTPEYNIALSEKRSRAVADYLARLGIDGARFRVIPKGEAEATGSSEDGWQDDRKVEFEWK